jgi:hypothetical protein
MDEGGGGFERSIAWNVEIVTIVRAWGGKDRVWNLGWVGGSSVLSRWIDSA